jgi:hypothetical protein
MSFQQDDTKRIGTSLLEEWEKAKEIRAPFQILPAQAIRKSR